MSLERYDFRLLWVGKNEEKEKTKVNVTINSMSCEGTKPYSLMQKNNITQENNLKCLCLMIENGSRYFWNVS